MKKMVSKALGFLSFIVPVVLLLQGCPSPTAVTPASVRPAPQLPEPETGPPVTDADGKTIGTTTIQKDAQGSIIGKNLQVSDSVTAINAFAFSSRGFTSVTIPPGVTSIAPRAFAGNPDLKSVTISQGLLNTTNPNAFPGGAASKMPPAESLPAYSRMNLRNRMLRARKPPLPPTAAAIRFSRVSKSPQDSPPSRLPSSPIWG